MLDILLAAALAIGFTALGAAAVLVPFAVASWICRKPSDKKLRR